jgi:4-hydroxythreonine-4-phosphate dehydrogenase
MTPRVLVFTQGDPAGIGPEVLLAALAAPPEELFHPLLLLERAAVAPLTGLAREVAERLTWFSSPPSRDELARLPARSIAAHDPTGARRAVVPGTSTAADAAGAMAALDLAIALNQTGAADALITAPVSKSSIARHLLPGFVGHTEYLAARCGLEHYGRDYLMAFLAPPAPGVAGDCGLQVALLSTHLPLRAALDAIRPQAVLDALRCLERHAGGRIAVAGVNPHAGEGGLLGSEDDRDVLPAVAQAQEEGMSVSGPLSADALFARAQRGAYDWVLALYHDQGLIAVKTASFGRATNWTLGLPILRTSVDHGTAFEIAGRGLADPSAMREVIRTTLALLSGALPRRAVARQAAAPAPA